MGRFSDFCIIQLSAHPARDERLNLGIAVFHEDRVDVRLSKRLDRLRALSAAIDIEDVRKAAHNLVEMDKFVRREGAESTAERASQMASYCGFNFSPLGQFSSASASEYDSAIAKLLQNLVEPEPIPILAARPRTSRLLTTIKKAFKQARILARKGESIDSHRIVPDHPIVDGLCANLVLRNGAMHIFETVDASGIDLSQNKLFKDIGRSTVVFEQSRMAFGEDATKTRLVYQASAAMEKIAKLSLDAVAHQGTELINWESLEDRQKFLVTVSALAEPLPPEGKTKSFSNIHASTQQRFNLN